MYKRRYFLYYLIIVSSIVSCKTYLHTASTEADYNRVTNNNEENEYLSSLIAPYRAKMAVEMDVNIGELGEDLIKARPNSNLGNWFTDILMAEADKMSSVK